MNEEVFVTDCDGDELLCIHHRAAVADSSTGVVIIVGGPQYRVGSHRQFIELARFLAKNGIPVLRFDYRGMGDSTGGQRSFDTIDLDIRTAVDAFFQRQPALRGVVLWGLCDAASAALIYAHQDPRISALILANPWVYTSSGEAETRLKNYYLKRLLSKEFWHKVLSGKVDWSGSVGSVVDYSSRFASGLVKRLLPGSGGSEDSTVNYIDRMRVGLENYTGPVHLLLSGDDLTAEEFRLFTKGSREWRQLLEEKVKHRLELPEANHTFSSRESKSLVEQTTLSWIKELQDSD